MDHIPTRPCTSDLMNALVGGTLTVAELLLLHGAQVNVPSGSENNIPLTLACWKGHRNVVELLLRNHSNIEHQNKAGCTPLMLAAREGHREATQLLLDYGAQINVPSGSNDDTPLTLACWKGHEDVVSLLISRKSNVNHQTKTGCTPLMEATREGHIGVARLLLCAGADVETPDNYGQSPFFMACWKGHADVAALLLEYDANKDCRTKTGITPLFQGVPPDPGCRKGNHTELAQLLLSRPLTTGTPLPLAVRFQNAHVELVEWLLGMVTHLPSDLELPEGSHGAHAPDVDLLPQRSKCLEMIMKAKKAREQAALKNAQILFEELDAEKEKKENKKKAAAKKRSKERKRSARSKLRRPRMQAPKMGEVDDLAPTCLQQTGEDGRRRRSSVVEGLEDSDDQFVDAPLEHHQPSTHTTAEGAEHDGGEAREGKEAAAQNVQPKGGGDAKPKQPAQPKKQDKHPPAIIATNQKNQGGTSNHGGSNGKGHHIESEQLHVPPVPGKLGNNQPSNNKAKSIQTLNSINHVQSREADNSLPKSSGSVKARAGSLSQKQLDELSVQTVAQTSTSESSLQTRNHSKSPCQLPSAGLGKLDSSQSESSNSDWGSEEMEAEEMRIIAMSRTDDDKLRSQHMKPSGGGGGVARPSATAGVPTSAVTTTSSSVTQSWQEVTRTTRSYDSLIISPCTVRQRSVQLTIRMLLLVASLESEGVKITTFRRQNRRLVLAARPGSPNHSLGKVASDAQLHLKAVNPSPAASRKMPLPVPMPSTLSESSRYLSTDSSTTTARSGIESITATQPASKGFSEARHDKPTFCLGPPLSDKKTCLRRPDLRLWRRLLPSPQLRPAPLQNSSGSGSSWSTPAQTSAAAVQQSALQAVDMGKQVESLRDSIVGGDGNEPSASVEQAPAKENSEGKRPDSKEMNLAVSSPSSAGDQSVPKTTKTVAVITPTPHTFQPSSMAPPTSSSEAVAVHAESSSSAPFGVIGPPRRGSVPSNGAGRSRKLAYAACLFLHGYPLFLRQTELEITAGWERAPPQVVYFAKPAEDLLPPGDGDQWMDRNAQSGGLYGPVGSVGEWSGPLTTPREPSAPLQFDDEQGLQGRKQRWETSAFGSRKHARGEPFSRHSPSRLVACGPTGQSQWDLQGQRLPLGNTRPEFQGKGNVQTIRAPPSVGEQWNKKDSSIELQQLMKSLDISEHLPVLRVSSVIKLNAMVLA
eukprot:Em0406g1a